MWQKNRHSSHMSVDVTWQNVKLQSSSEYQFFRYQSFGLLVPVGLVRLGSLSPEDWPDSACSAYRVPSGLAGFSHFSPQVPLGLARFSHFSPQVPLRQAGFSHFRPQVPSGLAGLSHIRTQVPLEPAGFCLLYTSPSPRDRTRSRMPSSA